MSLIIRHDSDNGLVLHKSLIKQLSMSVGNKSFRVSFVSNYAKVRRYETKKYCLHVVIYGLKTFFMCAFWAISYFVVTIMS